MWFCGVVVCGLMCGGVWSTYVCVGLLCGLVCGLMCGLLCGAGSWPKYIGVGFSGFGAVVVLWCGGVMCGGVWWCCCVVVRCGGGVVV